MPHNTPRAQRTRTWTVLGTLGLMVACMSQDDPEQTVQPDALPDTQAAAGGPAGADRPVVGAAIQPAVEEYRTQCRAADLERSDAEAADELTARCIRVLSGALASVVGRDTVSARVSATARRRSGSAGSAQCARVRLSSSGRSPNAPRRVGCRRRRVRSRCGADAPAHSSVP